MIKINGLKLPIAHSEDDIIDTLCKMYTIKRNMVKDWKIEKKSLDARKKNQIIYNYSITVSVDDEMKFIKHIQKKCKKLSVSQFIEKDYDFNYDDTSQRVKDLHKNAPVIVGAGPAGLFCAYELALRGFCPIILERGKSVDERLIDVEYFWSTGVLNPESNVQFGEGGAGTFSDGKLNTSVSDPLGRNKRVLKTLVEFGAPPSILYENKPHIGTDILITVVKGMRKRIQELGGVFQFESKMTALKIQHNQVCGVIVNDDKFIASQFVVLAIGHSARDTFSYLYESNIPMTAKPFAIGLRVEHAQKMINESQYGENHNSLLPPTSYKLTANLEDGTGVYSFCMCPGGYVVNASSQTQSLAINGMSYHKRDGENANSAIVVTVTPKDFGETSPLDGMRYQENLEQKTFQLCNGKIPVQRLEDFKKNIKTVKIGSVVPQTKGDYELANIRDILPEKISNSLIEGVEKFGKRIRGFDEADTILSAIETRTSSPIRIVRGDNFQSEVKGLFPCGEGAGYAGGITSAAIDGIKVFERIIK